MTIWRHSQNVEASRKLLLIYLRTVLGRVEATLSNTHLELIWPSCTPISISHSAPPSHPFSFTQRRPFRVRPPFCVIGSQCCVLHPFWVKPPSCIRLLFNLCLPFFPPHWVTPPCCIWPPSCARPPSCRTTAPQSCSSCIAACLCPASGETRTRIPLNTSYAYSEWALPSAVRSRRAFCE